MTQSDKDPIRLHLAKIEQGIDEVKFRSISTIYSKISNKVLQIDDLPLGYPDLPAVFLNFINEYQTAAPIDYIRKTIFILSAYSETQAGSKILNDYGTIEFFTQFRDRVKHDEASAVTLDSLLQKLVRYKTARSEKIKSLYSFPDKDTIKEKENENSLNISNISEIAKVKSTLRDFGPSQWHLQSQQMQPQQVQSQQLKSQQLQQQIPEPFQPGHSDSTQTLQMTKKPIIAPSFPTGAAGNNQRTLLKPSAAVNLESEELHRLKQRREDFFPFLIPYLDEQDQKFLFDITVQLKYGDVKSATRCLKELMPAVFEDFPLEALFSQPELIQELVNQVRRSVPDIQRSVLDLFATMLQGMLQTYNTMTLRENNNVNEKVSSEEFLASQDRDFVKQSYPGLNIEKLKSKEYVERQQKTQSSPTFFEIFDSILRSTFPLMNDIAFIDKIAKIWEISIFILGEFLPKRKELVKEALKDYVRGFVKVLNDLESKVFAIGEYYYLVKIFWRLWKCLESDDYRQIEGFKPASGLEFMNKAALRYMINQDEIEEALAYSRVLAPDTENKLRTSLSLLDSIKELQQFEERGGKLRYDSLETFAESEKLLSRLLIASPFSKLQSFFDHYITLAFFTTSVEYPEAKETYKRCRTNLIRLMNIPQLDLRVRFYEIFLQNLFSDEHFLQSYSKKSLTFQLLLDGEFTNELIQCGLVSEIIANSLTKIILNFISSATQHRLPIRKFIHVLSYLPLFYCLSKASASNVSSSCKIIKDALAHIDGISSLKLLLLDLFSHNLNDRRAAFRLLSNKNVIEDMLTNQLNTKAFIERYANPHSQPSESDLDPLSLFLDKDRKALVLRSDLETVAVEYTAASPLDFKVWADGSLEDLYNLLNVAKDRDIENNLRLSSIDQLCEYLGLLFKEEAALDGKDIKNYIRELLAFILVTLEGYAKSEMLPNLLEKGDTEKALAAKLLGLLTALTHLSKRLPVVAEALGTYLNLYDSKSHFLIKIALNFLHSKSSNCVYQGLKLLSLLAFITPQKTEYKVDVDPRLEESFYLMNMFQKTPYSFPEAPYWNLYPLEDNLRFYIEKFLESSNIRASTVNLQDKLLEEKIQTFNNALIEELKRNHDSANIFTVVEEWKRFLDTFVETIPSALCEFPIIPYAVKVMSVTLTAFNFSSGILAETAQLIASVLSHPGFLNQVNLSKRVFEDVLGLLDFLASQMIPIVLEIPMDNAREKMDLIDSVLLLITKLVALITKIKDPKFKQIVFKKVLKQNLLEVITKLVQFFYNNEEFLYKVAKLFQEMIIHPEIYLVYDLFPVINVLMDFLFNFKPSLSFRTKHLSKTLLTLFLEYTRIDETFRTRNLQVTQQSLRTMPLSESSKSNIMKVSTIGWLLRMTEDRETKVRVLAWNQLANILDKSSLMNYGSSIDTALNVIYSPNEAYSVVIASIHFLNNVLSIAVTEGDFQFFGSMLKSASRIEQDTICNYEGSSTRDGPTTEIESIFYRRNIISHLKNLLLKKNAPPLFYGGLILLLKNVVALNTKKSLPILSQLEIWDVLVELFSGKQWRRKHNGKREYQYEEFQTLIAMNNFVQFLLFAVSFERQIADYLINCTGILRSSLKWLGATSQLYKHATSNNHTISAESRMFMLDSFNENLLKLFNLLVFLNEDKAVFMINKFYEDKIPDAKADELNRHQKYNIFYLIAEILGSTKHSTLILAIFKLLGILIPKWSKGLKLMNHSDQNGETLAESLILTTYAQYKLNENIFFEGKLSQEEYIAAKAGILACCSAMLYGSNISKNAMLNCGFLALILSEFIETSESLLLEDIKVSTRTLDSPQCKSSPALGESSLGTTKTFKKSTLLSPRDSFLLYLRVLKYFFVEEAGIIKGLAEKTANIMTQKLQSVSASIFEAFNKSWRVAARREETLQEFLFTLTNFATNPEMNALLFAKLVDNKLVFFNDLLTLAQKLDNPEVWQFTLILRNLCSFTHSKEFRNFIYRSKILENSCSRLLKIWNLRKEFSLQNPIIICFLHLYLSLSFYKDSLTRILSDKQLLDLLADLTELTGFRGPFADLILTLLANLAYHKSNKSHFLSNEQVMAIFLAVISNEGYDFKLRVRASQFFANIIYKCAEAVTLLNKEHIVDQFFFLRKEMEREVDKLTLLTEHENEEDQQKLKLTKIFLENLNKINLVFKGVVMTN